MSADSNLSALFNMRLHAISTWMIIAIVGMFYPVARGDEFNEIKLGRPDHVGQISDFATSFHIHNVTEIVDKPNSRWTDDRVIGIRGRQTIVAVNEEHAVELKILIEDCTLNGQMLIKKGSTLFIDARQPTSKLSVDDKEPEKRVVDNLTALFRGDQKGMPDSDAVFGRSGKAKPGDSWEIHRDAMKKRLELQGTPAEPNSIRGSVFCGNVERTNDGPCIRISNHWQAEAAQTTIQQMHILAGSVSQTTTGLFPVDANAPGPVESHSESNSLIVASRAGADGKPETITYHFNETADWACSIVAP